MAAYGWAIDIDHQPDANSPGGTKANATGVTGPSGTPDHIVAELAKGKGRKFRIVDGDGELYYEGRWIGPGWMTDDGARLDESAFGPLADFGTPNAGATDIYYTALANNTGPWVQL
jgi:hypothetical protein